MATRYAAQHAKEPSALWYIVNQTFTLPPAHRRPVLAGSDEDVDAFAKQSGLAISTVELFRICRGAELGETSANEARQLLVTSAGRLKVES